MLMRRLPGRTGSELARDYRGDSAQNGTNREQARSHKRLFQRTFRHRLTVRDTCRLISPIPRFSGHIGSRNVHCRE
jgi:hypothetical protein